MMSKAFEITNARREKIADALSTQKHKVEKTTVDLLHKVYDDEYSPLLKEQYLAHYMRALEQYFRKVLKNNRFIVSCKPYESPADKRASSLYWEPCETADAESSDKSSKHPKPGNAFLIHYDPELKNDELKLRDYIAHEIGHLFWDATF